MKAAQRQYRRDFCLCMSKPDAFLRKTGHLCEGPVPAAPDHSWIKWDGERDPVQVFSAKLQEVKG